MSALLFDPWALLKTQVQNEMPADLAKVANREKSKDGALAGLATLAGAWFLPCGLSPLAWPRSGISTPDWSRLDELDAGVVAGYERTARMLPPAWSDPAAWPSRGGWCSCCHGQRWWTEASNRRGWRCSTCCPGDHLPMTRRQEVISDELG